MSKFICVEQLTSEQKLNGVAVNFSHLGGKALGMEGVGGRRLPFLYKSQHHFISYNKLILSVI